MKPTVRVSIGGFAFNLEEDAYDVLNDYIQSLKRHFQGNPEADEIIADIEQRLSELLQIRMSKHEGAVSIDDALEIVKIMGNPKDFGDNVSDESQSKDEEDGTFNDSLKKKRLFRDTDNKVFGGVCSGLAHYFKIDMALVRLLFVGLFFLSFIPSFYIGGEIRNYSFIIIIGIYIILWIIMPAAKTFSQKLLMTGADPSIENIEEKPLKSIRKYRGSGITSFLNVMLNVFVAIIAIVVLVSILIIIGVWMWFYFDTDILASANYFTLFGYNSETLMFISVLVSVLPLMGLFFLMLKILRRSPFTKFTFFSFTLGLIIWIGSICYLGNKIAKTIYEYQKEENVEETVELPMKADNLYVTLGDEYLEAKMQPNASFFLYKDDADNNRNICVLPNISIEEDSTILNYSMEINKKSFGRDKVLARQKVEAMQLNYYLTDSILTINPKWYNNDNPWNLEVYELKLKIPKGKKVELKAPLGEGYQIRVNTKYKHNDYYSFLSFYPYSINISIKNKVNDYFDSE